MFKLYMSITRGGKHSYEQDEELRKQRLLKQQQHDAEKKEAEERRLAEQRRLAEEQNALRILNNGVDPNPNSLFLLNRTIGGKLRRTRKGSKRSKRSKRNKRKKTNKKTKTNRRKTNKRRRKRV